MKLILHYNLRQLRVRRWSSLTTLLGVALVCGVFCYMLAFADGLRRTLTVTADPHNLIVIAEGATAESNSAVTHDDAVRLAAVPNLATNSSGRPLVSPEVVVQTNVSRRGDQSGALAGVAIRGVDPEVALAVRPTVELVAGRWFRPGTDEVVVGQAASRQFTQGTVGAVIDCGDRRFDVVGVFRAAGSAHESEFWGYVSNVSAAYRRDMYSCAVVRLSSTDERASQETIARIASSAVALRAIPEGPYYAGQTENARVVLGMALLIVFVMGIGAVFAAMNVMHSALADRVREIGVLRAIGFARRSLMFGLVAESVMISLAGGFLGCVATAVFIVIEGGSRDLVGTTTFTSVAFTIVMQPAHVALSLAVAAAIGILGGLWPAHRAAKIPVVVSLRTA